MDRKELKMRLAAIGWTKVDFAAALGISRLTIYQWEVVPRYAEAYLELMERLSKLEKRT